MKESPQARKLEEILRSSQLVAGGFMGYDTRPVSEIIESDCAEVSRLGQTVEQIAERMRLITEKAKQRLGCWTEIDASRRARVDEAKGFLVCPWSHPGRFAKRVTIVTTAATGQTIRWSDLNIHMIAEHCFFEGRGSAFRIEPGELVF